MQAALEAPAAKRTGDEAGRPWVGSNGVRRYNGKGSAQL
jgi:uracil-DNA glycosylase